MRERKPFFWFRAGCSEGASGFVEGGTGGAATIRGGGITGVGAVSGPALNSCAGLITRPSPTRETSTGAELVATCATVTVFVSGLTTTVFVTTRGREATWFVGRATATALVGAAAIVCVRVKLVTAGVTAATALVFGGVRAAKTGG